MFCELLILGNLDGILCDLVYGINVVYFYGRIETLFSLKLTRVIKGNTI